MSRPPASIIILAWNAWESTRVCLDSLRPTLGAGDQVIVVDNGSTDGTGKELQRYTWVDVITNPVNRGFAGGCNDGAAAARSDVLVFLNNDTALGHMWLDPLVAALMEDRVGAVGPRSNFVSGDQLVDDVPYHNLPEMRKFARAWCRSHRGQTSDVTRLVGFCMAIKKLVFEQIGGFDEEYGLGGYEDDDLCMRLMEAGYRLKICHESFVHHDGHKTFDVNGVDRYREQEANWVRFALRCTEPLSSDSEWESAVMEAQNLAQLNRSAEASDAILSALWLGTTSPGRIVVVVRILVTAGRPLTDLAASMPLDRSVSVMGHLLELDDEVADPVMEAFFSEHPTQPTILAAAAILAKRLPVERALVWSSRLREAGHPEACPLVAIAASPASPILRARAAAAAVGLFGDERAEAGFWAAYHAASEPERHAIQGEAGLLCPSLLGEESTGQQPLPARNHAPA